MADLTTGKMLNEGKTKVIYELPKHPGLVLVQSKDRITAGDGERAHDLVGKAAIATATTCKVFELLNACGMKTHFVKRGANDTAFVAKNCDMIPIEWVTRRVATGSFLKRNIGVKEGFKFNPPKLETFFKDDANHDPQWSEEVLISTELKCGSLTIGRDEVELMNRMTVLVFEILERAWASIDCALIDMKIEFGVHEGEIVVADVIDSDSWRLWPSGDKRLMKDKQVYRDLKNVTQEALDLVKSNFKWISERLNLLMPPVKGLVVILMGSPTDEEHCKKIAKTCRDFGIPTDIRCTSAHKGTQETLSVLAQYEGTGVPVVFVAVAGRSNGLGPVLSGNTPFPVINCPPVKSDTAARDVWSSLDVPSGLGCTTVLYPEAAGYAAAQIFAMNNHVMWSKLRVKQFNNYATLKAADKKIKEL